jgi:hypothetical protein
MALYADDRARSMRATCIIVARNPRAVEKMRRPGFPKTAAVAFAQRQSWCRVFVAIASLGNVTVSMGDSRNEEATNSNGFGIAAERSGWMPVHGLPMAWRTGEPDLPAGNCGHLRNPLRDALPAQQRLRSVQRLTRCQSAGNAWPGNHVWTLTADWEEANHEKTYDAACVWNSVGRHDRLPRERVLDLRLEFPLPPGAQRSARPKVRHGRSVRSVRRSMCRRRADDGALTMLELALCQSSIDGWHALKGRGRAAHHALSARATRQSSHR